MKLVFCNDKNMMVKHFYYKDNLNTIVKDEKQNDLISIKGVDGSLIVTSSNKYKITTKYNDDKSIIEETILENNNTYYLKNTIDNSNIVLYTMDDIDDNYKCFYLNNNATEIKIGGKYFANANITFNDTNLDYSEITLTKVNNYYTISINGYPYNIYNGEEILISDQKVCYGDYIFIYGITFTFIGNIIFIYNGKDKITASRSTLNEINSKEFTQSLQLSNTPIKNYNFKRTPRIQRTIVEKVFSIDPPSSQELKESTPVIYTILPMMMMSTMSLMSLVNVIDGIASGKKSFEESLPSIIVSGCMIGAMLLYPILSNIYKKRRESKREIKRIEEYKEYIYEQKRKILEEIEFQKNIYVDTYFDTTKSKEIIEKLTNNLWERKKGSDEFLRVSLGLGSIKPKIAVKIPEEHFTIDKDKLRIQLVKLQEETEFIKDVPIVIDLFNNNVIGLIGKNELNLNYIKCLNLRLMASHTHDDLKIVVLTSKDNINFWNQYKNLSYLWSKEEDIRFFGDDDTSISRIINYLDEMYRSRVSNIEKEVDYRNEDNILIYVDDINIVKNIPFINTIINTEKNYGFSIIFNTNKMDELPSECSSFIYLEKDEGKVVINKNKVYYEQTFKPDLIYSDFYNCYNILSNIELDSYEKKYILPNKLGFLEMYNAGTIDNLQIKEKWLSNNITESLSAPIGIGDNGEPLYLNLHETAHGPHGLVAGMTGSGKSELLITYILSLAVNYNPEEVQFVLIDYKGGGLANTFYNSTIGMILPHVVGVITNINENEINRSLISLQSEVKRRQKVFATVSKRFNEGNMDIYKYVTISKENSDVEPLSHLFIISDEFAELKTQNPEFINQLISIARIGRSLGIHLILATQKPSGIVDDQIWSNSRFKICLKVQDKSDSNDMIKVADAAYLKNAGRFYLQVGYNELFLKGQSAYSGTKYIEKNMSDKASDKEIDFINDYGKKYYKVSLEDNIEKESNTKEVTILVKSIIELSKTLEYKIKGLWRELIPEKIYYEDLIQKYEYKKQKNIEIVFGEYDAPDMQQKGLATLDIENGNTIIYGNVGSGKANLLEMMTYSLINAYSSSEVNIYIMDFGAETLNAFNESPQVGDIISINDKEKIFNSFKMFESIINNRKDLLEPFNGDLNKYNDQNTTKLPFIIVEINLLENLFEYYDELRDPFLQLTRDSIRYGVGFIITTNGVNNIRTKTIQGFKQSIVLELKDKYDYSNILGSKVMNLPMKYLGRGMLKLNNVYEFQTSYVKKDLDNYAATEQKIAELNSMNMIKVPSIPVLPKTVNYNFMKKYLSNGTQLPVGIFTDDLLPANFQFINKKGIIIASLEIDICENFLYSLEQEIFSFNNNKAFIFSSKKDIEDKFNQNNIILDNFNTNFEQLNKYSDNSSEFNNYIIFYGINDIFSKLQIIEKKGFSDLLKKLNEKNNFSLIFIDSSSNLKKLEFEEFYRSNINNNRGIWIGNGITEQMNIKYNRIPREYREEINEKYGFLVENLVVKKMKIVDFFGGDNE